MEKTGMDANAFVAMFRETRDKYRNQVKDNGYPWGKTN
jgi:hypothetical protein